MANWKKYAGGGVAEAPARTPNWRKYREAGPPERREVESYSGKTYEGMPEQLALWRAKGGLPEEAGLQLKRQPKTTGEAVAETGIRLAAPVGGLITGGPAGFIGGSVAAEEIIGAIDRATGQADAVTPVEGAVEGAKTGALNLALGHGAGLAGRGVGALAGRLAPSIRAPAALLGETGALAGYGAAESGSLNPQDIAIAGIGAGVPRAYGGLKRLAGERRARSAMGTRETELQRPGVSRNVYEFERLRGEGEPPAPRARDLEPTEVIEGYRPPSRVSSEDLGAKPILSPEDAALVRAHVARMRGTGEPGGGGGLRRDLEGVRAGAEGRHGEAVRRLVELERPRSVGEEYRAMRAEGEEFPGLGGGAFEKGGRYRPGIRGAAPEEPPHFTARRTDPDTGEELSVARAPELGVRGWVVYSRPKAPPPLPGEMPAERGKWKQVPGLAPEKTEADAIGAMARHLGMAKPTEKLRAPMSAAGGYEALFPAGSGRTKKLKALERKYGEEILRTYKPGREPLSAERRAALLGEKAPIDPEGGKLRKLEDVTYDVSFTDAQTGKPAPGATVKGQGYNGLAMRQLEGGAWQVEHPGTGYRVFGGHNRDAAEEGLRQLADRFDWSKAKTTEDIKAMVPAEVKARARAMNRAGSPYVKDSDVAKELEAIQKLEKPKKPGEVKQKAEKPLAAPTKPEPTVPEAVRSFVKGKKPAALRSAEEVLGEYNAKLNQPISPNRKYAMRRLEKEMDAIQKAGKWPKPVERISPEREARILAAPQRISEIPPNVREFVSKGKEPVRAPVEPPPPPPVEPTGQGGPPPAPPGGKGGKKPPKPPKAPPAGEPVPEGEAEFTEGHKGGLAGARHTRAESARSPASPKGPVETRTVGDPESLRKEVHKFMRRVFEVQTLKNADDEFPAGTLRTLRMTTQPPPGYKFKLERGERAEVHRRHNLLVAWEVDDAGKYLRQEPRSFHLDEVLEIVTPDGKRIRYVPKAKPAAKREEKAGQEAAGAKPPPTEYPTGVSAEDRALAYELFPEKLTKDGGDLNAADRSRFLRHVEQFSSQRRAEDVRRTRRDLERGRQEEIGEGQPARIRSLRDRPELAASVERQGRPPKPEERGAREIGGGAAREPRERFQKEETVPTRVREFAQRMRSGEPPEPRLRFHRGEEPAPRIVREPQRELGQGAEAREPREYLEGFGRERPVPRLPRKPTQEIGRGAKPLEPAARGPRKPTGAQARRLEELGRGEKPDPLDIPGRIPSALKRHPAAVAGRALEATGKALELPSKALDKLIDQVFGPDAPRWVRGAAAFGGIGNLVRGGAKLGTGVAIPAIAGRGLQKGGRALRRLAADPERRARIREHAGRLQEAAKDYPALAGVAAYFAARDKDEED